MYVWYWRLNPGKHFTTKLHFTCLQTTPFLRQGLTKYSASLGLTSIGRLLTQPQTGLQACTTNPSKNSIFVISKPKPFTYLRQPAVLVSTDSHSICRGLQSSLGSLSQPECGMITSSVKACNAWSTISILIESWDERFHRVPGRDKSESSLAPKTSVSEEYQRKPYFIPSLLFSMITDMFYYRVYMTPCSVSQASFCLWPTVRYILFCNSIQTHSHEIKLYKTVFTIIYAQQSTPVSLPQQPGHFGPHNSLLWEVILSIVGCLSVDQYP